MSLPFILYRVQQADSQIDQHRLRLQEIEVALSQDEELAQARLEENQAQHALAEAQKNLRKAEEEVASQRIKIEQTEAALYGGRVRSPKELQDLQKEAAALKRYLVVLEDRQIESMIIFEEMESVYQQAADHLREASERNQSNNQLLISEKNNLILEIGRLTQERDAASQGLAAEQINTYQNLRQSRRGVAVSRVINGNCSACGTHLSAALLHASRSQTQLTRCSTCGRILYIG
jgi:hypothetical protein